VLDHFDGAIDAVAPTYDHCSTKIVGHGVEAEGALFGCAHGASHVEVRGCGIARDVFVMWEHPHEA